MKSKEGTDRCVRERDLERLLTLQQAQGKSSQAISKLSRSAPATLAPHNYNTIWQRYWAQIPSYFCRCVYPARAWFYIKVPKMALAVTYWKERPCSPAEWANTVRICWLSRVQQRQHRGWAKCPLPCPSWRTSFCKGDLFLHATSRRPSMQGGVGERCSLHSWGLAEERKKAPWQIVFLSSDEKGGFRFKSDDLDMHEEGCCSCKPQPTEWTLFSADDDTLTPIHTITNLPC